MFQKLFRKNTESVGDANSQKDYLEYCKSIEQTLSKLESSLHTSDSPEEIAMMAMQTACEFYGADWCGFLEVDLDLGLWTPYWWHNVSPEDKTMDLLEEFGSAANLYRWVRAMKHNQAMIVPDVQTISEKYPDEFSLYGRLRVNSLLAVPVKPRPVGFLVVRNPVRFVGRSSMLQMLAFVVLSAINEHRLFESARLTASHDIIQSETDILINMFGNLEIHTSRGVLRESELNSPLIYRMIAYFLLNRKTVVTSYELAEAVYPGEAVDMDNPGKNIKALLYRFRKSFALICEEPLIVTTPNGYQLNPKLHIMTDLQQFDKCWETSQQTASLTNKVDLLKQAMRMYRGDVCSSVGTDHWLLQTAAHYRLMYHTCVNELLKSLNEVGDYPDVMKYATLSLTTAPENKEAYRPVVIIQNNIGNKHSSTVIVAAVSTRKELRAKLPVHCHIGAESGLDTPSTILLEQLRTMSKKRLTNYVGRLTDTKLAELNRAVAISVGLIEPDQKRMVLSLCGVCVNHFYGSGSYYLRRTDPIQVIKEPCTYCNQSLGFEYELTQKSGGRGK